MDNDASEREKINELRRKHQLDFMASKEPDREKRERARQAVLSSDASLMELLPMRLAEHENMMFTHEERR